MYPQLSYSHPYHQTAQLVTPATAFSANPAANNPSNPSIALTQAAMHMPHVQMPVYTANTYNQTSLMQPSEVFLQMKNSLQDALIAKLAELSDQTIFGAMQLLDLSSLEGTQKTLEQKQQDLFQKAKQASLMTKGDHSLVDFILNNTPEHSNIVKLLFFANQVITQKAQEKAQEIYAVQHMQHIQHILLPYEKACI